MILLAVIPPLMFVHTTAISGQEKPMSLQELEIQELEARRTDPLKETLWGIVDKISRSKRHKCLRTFGHDSFCVCLTDTIGVSVSFEEYVALVTKTRAELNYDQLSKDQRTLVDHAYATRDLCVFKVFGH